MGEKATIEELLILLEEGIWSSIQQQEINRISSESSSQWALAVQFCRIHNVKLSTSYLRECAKANDWLQFIIHSQLHNYHPEEVKSLLQYFSPVLEDHLRLAFENLPLVSNSRMDSDQVCNRSPQEFQGNKEEMTDLFEVLLQCSEEPNSGSWLLAEAVKQQAPILSVLASCLQGASTIPCLCVWIITSVEESVAAEATGHIQGSVEGHMWELQDLSVIWKTLLTRRKSKTLIRGFHLFLKDSPLLLMMEMYELCMFFKNYKEAKVKLLEFEKSFETVETTATRVHATIPAAWLKEQVCFLLKLMLQQCGTQYELGKLLQLFVGIEHLFCDGPDVKKLCVLSKILKDTSIAINPVVISSYSPENFQHECRSILEKLETEGQFALARRVAELADEKHNMIALCFSMCREIGENHEAAACIQLKLIESQPWEDRLKDGHHLKQLLLKALTLMLDAAESYAKDSCVRQALHCHRLTKLITLQIHFLNTGQNTMLINLGRHRLMDCIIALPRFYQASIVAEAYDFVPDWAEILYQQVIVKGDFNYLEEFKQQRLLRSSVFEEISKKYKQHQPTDTAVKNLKKLLTYCEDVYLYYKLAYEHKFYDIVNMLLKDPQTGCCLKDMLAG
uniref:Spatacsin C-terminal domain-containing protein n=1 Tax=Lynx canadensis TaxID=61383 RepID=A0A667H401_LYNCA